MAEVKPKARHKVGINIALEGLAEALDGMKDGQDTVLAGARAVMAKIGLDLLGKAVRDAPVELGDLRGSGYALMGGRSAAESRLLARGDAWGASGVKGRGAPTALTEPVVEVGFTARYAVRQHEELEWRHPRGGRAKYLEANANRDSSLWAQWLADELKGRLGG